MLGRVYLGQRGGLAAVQRWNENAALGRLNGNPFSFSVKGYSSPRDQRLAEDVFRFQHAAQCVGQLSIDPSSIDPYSRDRADCVNRDGMIGHKTMCLIVKAIQSGTPWGQFWAQRIEPGARNMAKYGAGSGECSLDCRQIACQYKARASCPPCRVSSGAPTVTQAGLGGVAGLVIAAVGGYLLFKEMS